jgi:antitoxin FitA
MALMPSLQVKDVPDQIHDVLRRRAAAAGQSLQEYVMSLLEEHAAAATVKEVFERISFRSGGSISFGDAVAVIRSDRDRR